MKAKKTRKIHTQEFKQEAVNLAAKQGVAKRLSEKSKLSANTIEDV